MDDIGLKAKISPVLKTEQNFVSTPPCLVVFFREERHQDMSMDIDIQWVNVHNQSIWEKGQNATQKQKFYRRPTYGHVFLN